MHSHSCISKIVWHWTPLDIEAQPTCSTSSNIPTCRWTLHLPPAEFYETLPPLTPPLFTGFFQKKGKSDFSKFNLQRMVFTLHMAKKENALVCECREIHPVSLQCHKVCQLIHTKTFLSEGSQTGTFLGSTAGCLNSIYFTCRVLFANRHGFNAIDTSTGKQLYLPSRNYQGHKSELGTR